MILQISKGNKKIYQEAESISLSKVDLSEMPKISKDDLLEVLNLEVNPENKMYFDMDGVMSDEERLNAEKAVKVAVLLDGEISHNNKTLIFSGNTTIYLLNSNGKTIQRFWVEKEKMKRAGFLWEFSSFWLQNLIIKEMW